MPQLPIASNVYNLSSASAAEGVEIGADKINSFSGMAEARAKNSLLHGGLLGPAAIWKAIGA